MLRQPTEVKLHLTFVFRLEASLLQLHNDQTFQFAVVEKEVDVEVIPVELNTFLASHKREGGTHLQEKRLQFAQDGILKITL